MSEGAWLIEVSGRGAGERCWGDWRPDFNERPHFREVDALRRIERLKWRVEPRFRGFTRWRVRRWEPVADQAPVVSATWRKSWLVGLGPRVVVEPGVLVELRWRAQEPWTVQQLVVTSPPSAVAPWWSVVRVDVGRQRGPATSGPAQRRTVALGTAVAAGQDVVVVLRNLTRRKLRPWATLALVPAAVAGDEENAT